MPSIKVYPPKPLPDRGVSETQFKIWIEELEVYLSQEEGFRKFLPGEAYESWSSQKLALFGGFWGQKISRDPKTDVFWRFLWPENDPL